VSLPGQTCVSARSPSIAHSGSAGAGFLDIAPRDVEGRA